MRKPSAVGRAARIAGAFLVFSAIPLTPPAEAQTGDGLGGYSIVASGAGFTAAPTVPAVLPVETPVEGTLALALATLSSGGQGFGMASSVFPGTPITGLRPLLDVGAGVSLPIPDYPILVQSREHEDAKSSGVPGLNMSSDVDPDRSTVTSDLGGFSVPGVFDIAAVRTVSVSTIEATVAAAVSETEVNGIEILDGVLRIDSITTVASAETDATAAACGGSVTVTGATVGGNDVTIDESGVHASGQSIPLASPDDSLRTVLETTGLTARVLGGAEACEGDHASRTTSGVLVSIPLPAAGPVPPGGRLDIIFGSTSATARATKPFEFPAPDIAVDPPTIADVVPLVPGPASPGTGPEPAVAAPTETPRPNAPVPTVAVGNDSSRADYTFAGVPAGLVIGLMLLSVPTSRRIRLYLERVSAMAASA